MADAATRRCCGSRRKSLERAIAQVQVGGRVSDIGHAVQEHVEAHGFSVVREFVGHGIGALAARRAADCRTTAQPGRGPRLAEGMVLAIEPMVEHGQAGGEGAGGRLDGGDADGSLSAHFEHTVAVTTDGPLVLTLPAGGGSRAARGGRERARWIASERAGESRAATGRTAAVVRETLPRGAVPGGDRRAAADYGARAGGPGRNFVRCWSATGCGWS